MARGTLLLPSLRLQCGEDVSQLTELFDAEPIEEFSPFGEDDPTQLVDEREPAACDGE